MTIFILNVTLTMAYTIFLLAYTKTRTRDTYAKLYLYNWLGVIVAATSVVILLTTALPSGSDAPDWSGSIIVAGLIALVATWISLVMIVMNSAFTYDQMNKSYRYPGPGIYVDTKQDIETVSGYDLDCHYKYVVVQVTKEHKQMFHPEKLSWQITSTHKKHSDAKKAAKHLCESPKPIFVGMEPEKIC